jgi:multidrug transporter EmrE-like cation transporter
MEHPGWLWIPITVWAAFAQTLRNAAQRGLTSRLGTLGATLVRFLYGLPFALLWLWLVQAVTGAALPQPGASFAALFAIASATVGVLLLSPADKDRPLRALLAGWTGKPALLGLASGTAFAFAAVGYRGAALGLVELIFAYLVSLKLFRERLSAMELGGMALIAFGIVVITLGR